MKKVFIVFIFGCFLSHNLLAQTTAQSRRTRSGMQTELNRLNDDIAGKERQIAEEERRMTQLRREVLVIEQDIDNRCGGFFQGWLTSCSQMSDATYEAKKEEIERLKATIRSVRDSFENNRRTLGRLKREARDIENQQEIFPEVMATEIRMLNVQTRLLELTGDVDDIDDKLDDIERVYDASLLGAYLQDKIGQLLNSNVICQISRRCNGGDGEISASDIQKELFPNTQTRSGYRRKVRARGSR